MLSGQALVMPQKQSLLGALIVASLAFLGSQSSAITGYALALLTIVVIVVATHMSSIWATQAKKESPIVFSLFWGLIIGLIVPFLITSFLDGGVSALYEIFAS
ncbi:hypothetical protein [Pleionea sediminis]|uniref:hypothetical protein n=1 Tax=Pleionea sediminis TaxID=2569479 RepID=UPI00118534AD|nr:hypothetical protein [Pleionea sediminis]